MRSADARTTSTYKLTSAQIRQPGSGRIEGTSERQSRPFHVQPRTRPANRTAEALPHRLRAQRRLPSRNADSRGRYTPDRPRFTK
jgi:hypothetical protein